MSKWHRRCKFQVQTIKVENITTKSNEWRKRFRTFFKNVFLSRVQVCTRVDITPGLKVRRKVALLYGIILWALSAASAILNGVELDAYDDQVNFSVDEIVSNLKEPIWSMIYECLLSRWLHWTVSSAASALPPLPPSTRLTCFILYSIRLRFYQLCPLSPWESYCS